jgi:integrase
MQYLSNNCRIGKFSVYPSNWESPNAKFKCIWRITYWFYDDNLQQKKQIPIKGMNRAETLKDKQESVRDLIKLELENLKAGYNPIAKTIVQKKEIDENTGLLEALNYALKNVELEHRTRVDVTNSFKYITHAIKELRHEHLPVNQVKPKHIKLILDACGEIKTYTDSKGNIKPRAWGAYQFNRYRTYLSLLISFLIDKFIVDSNPVRDVKKQEQLIKIRETVTKEQRFKLREEINTEELYTFFRFINIYFNSNRRITELLAVKKEHVRLEDQKFKVTMKKGKKFKELWATIENPALHFWEEIYNEAENGQYLFGLNLKPQFRVKPASGEIVGKRWNRHVKKKLGITADLASLRHTHADELAEMFGKMGGVKEGIKKAQDALGHSTPVITMRYLVNQEERNHEEAKQVISRL